MSTARQLAFTTAVFLALAGSIALRHPLPGVGEALTVHAQAATVLP